MGYELNGLKFIEWQKANPEEELERRRKISLGNSYPKTLEHRKKLSLIKKELYRKGKLKIKGGWNKGLNKENNNSMLRISIDRKLHLNKFLNSMLKGQENKRINFHKSYHTSHKIGILNLPNICSICKSTKKLIVHHINGNARDNELNNLIIFCRKCHSIIHRELDFKNKIRAKGKIPEYIEEKILERDNFTCRNCQSENKLEIHHIDNNIENNSLDNLITLCKSCHQPKQYIKRGVNN